MIKLKNLKINNEYYIIGEDGGYDPKIIRLKVVKEKQGKRGKYVVVQFLKYLEREGERDVKYYNQKEGEIITERLYLDEEENLFGINHLKQAKELLMKRECEMEREMCELENYRPPEDYPDWDGDESIMYLLDL